MKLKDFMLMISPFEIIVFESLRMSLAVSIDGVSVLYNPDGDNMLNIQTPTVSEDIDVIHRTDEQIIAIDYKGNAVFQMKYISYYMAHDI